ncbi:MAG: hypothetical protein US68_C0006G0078 [Candidatus Shapirobacteria bacterium GW2011_GWE1_38_10]|uniref:Uncharacterized protein n=1 Tax=Candidatus Shapirobacteria bacterium GW2011_GWE1_38_10 TaxID=1618488 RepID=A0A0G0I4Y4_9BACT|nr:MAG: hypothetical protein US46_C0002G0101 [Candidatus Shapirobacteria bacterium GW2011_GWF2_37_20]KKQ50398.1 MAG: hypothetical protein US68_C0006G0078 [Candidatus Shapirobacteria bacterium GW2011_GWE1_38_10]KKQ65223.1 MAG: hypothetical protein US85_C0001G0150 [Candidatus Shapirobacteria bacterium GW2011_GWF1_38_23]HBP51201.1 hypothetical protein [Candidatus Shapirobacteria bacterium]
MAIKKPGDKPSIFFKIASQVEKERLSEIVGKGIRRKFQVKNHKLYSPVLGEKSELSCMETMGVVTISSPEAEIISGAGGFDKDNKFVLPRYHFGPLAQLDMEVAMYQLANTPKMKKLINRSRADNSGIIYFAREGHLTNWQRALFLVDETKNIPSTIVAMSHKDCENIYTRESQLSVKPNLEGFNLNNLEILYISDPVASGMQHVKMLEELVKIGCKPKTVVTIAPMATAFGMRVISLACKKLKVNFVGGCCSALLESTKPLRYYSPYPAANENQVVDANLHSFVRKFFGDKLNKACIRCNWTGTFLGGPKMPLEASEEELRSVGSSNQEMLNICNKVTVEEAKKSGVYERLIPYSTRLMQSK